MRLPLTTATAVVLAVAALGVFGAAPSEAPEAGAPVELIVRFDRSASAADRAQIREAAGTELERTLPVRGMQLVEVQPGQAPATAERTLERAEGVLYAEPNVTRRAFVLPDDPYFNLLWGLENTGQPIRGAAGTPDADSDAADAWDAQIDGETVVAVVDTGVDGAHPDLVANMWRNPGEVGAGRESNAVDDDLNGRVDDWRGWDFVAGDNDPADENGHGTHVAGTIGAERDNATGVAGVTDQATLMPLRVLDADGSGSVSDVILAYSYAATNGARVVNLSLGSSGASRAERDAIAAFPSMLFVAAAGNGGDDGVGDDNDNAGTYPCAYLLPNVLCVAASDTRDQLAGLSNYGATSVDLAAPGVSIVSTWPGGVYSWSSGTSMATPHVAGAAALLWAATPDASVSDVSTSVLSGVDASQSFTERTVTGGRLNVLRSLELVADVAVGSPAPAPRPDASSAPAPQPEPSPAPGPPAAPSAPVADAVAPRLSIRASRHQRLSALLNRGIAARVGCSEPCTVQLQLRAGRRALTVSRRLSITGTAGRRIAVRLTRRGRRILRRGSSRALTLAGAATDASGNRRTLSVALRVRR